MDSLFQVLKGKNSRKSHFLVCVSFKAAETCFEKRNLDS